MNGLGSAMESVTLLVKSTPINANLIKKIVGVRLVAILLSSSMEYVKKTATMLVVSLTEPMKVKSSAAIAFVMKDVYGANSETRNVTGIALLKVAFGIMRIVIVITLLYVNKQI